MFKTGHWNHSFILTPDNSFGFIYYIENKLNGKKYIGKKQYFSYKAGKKHKESDWKTYTSSSKYLNEDIKINGELSKENNKVKVVARNKVVNNN